MSVTELLDTLKYFNIDSSKEIDILEYKNESLSNDVAGSAKNEIKGLKYILNKHSNILCTYIPDKIYKQFIITWTCETIKGFRKHQLQIDQKIISYLKNCLKDKDFAAVLMSIQYNKCKSNEKIRAHANLLIYNKLTNTIERFDPMGGIRKEYENIKLDRKLKDYFNKYNINYSSPNEFCPKVSFQKLQGKEKEFKFGLCAAWTLWFLDFKLSNLNISDSSVLINLALDKLNKPGSKSLTTFILNYIRFILV